MCGRLRIDKDSIHAAGLLGAAVLRERKGNSCRRVASSYRPACLFSHSIELQRGLGGLRLKPGEIDETLVELLPGTAVNAGVQQQESYCCRPGDIDSSCQHKNLLGLVLDESPLHQTNRKIAHQ
jgi:hypothetical protein